MGASGKDKNIIYDEIDIDIKYWDKEKSEWDTHNALKTTCHSHIDSFENGWFEVLVVEINDGDFFISKM